MIGEQRLPNPIRTELGLARLAAANALGWEHVDAIEIAENLHRVGLTKAERDAHIRWYAELLKTRREREAESLVRQKQPEAAPPEDDPEARYQRGADCMDHLWRIADPEWRQRWMMING